MSILWMVTPTPNISLVDNNKITQKIEQKRQQIWVVIKLYKTRYKSILKVHL